MLSNRVEQNMITNTILKRPFCSKNLQNSYFLQSTVFKSIQWRRLSILIFISNKVFKITSLQAIIDSFSFSRCLCTCCLKACKKTKFEMKSRLHCIQRRLYIYVQVSGKIYQHCIWKNLFREGTCFHHYHHHTSQYSPHLYFNQYERVS